MGSFSFPKSDLQSAETLLQQGKVGSILFSEGTYQAEVSGEKSKKILWPFLQLDDEGNILDHFCTCSVAEEKQSCPHQAAAWLKIINGKLQPLHVRFRASLWNEVCLIASRRHGYDPEALKGTLKSGFKAFSPTGKDLFSMKPLTEKGRKKIKEIITHRPQETEETSIKFSNLPAEELALWKEGRPSEHLQYELSFWSDLAKWWMALQENEEPYKLNFTIEDEIPKTMEVAFKDAVFTCYIAEANWNRIIPALATVESPLKVFELTHRQIKRILYNPLKKSFELDLGKVTQEVEAPGATYPLGEWIFVPKKGFYPSRMDTFLKEREVPAARVGAFLQKHLRLVEKYLVGTKIHSEPVTPQYHLSFDANYDLHLSCYLFERGDLQKMQTAQFPPWVYLPGHGFYLLQDLLFEELEKVIPRSQVGDFVSRHRHFLSTYEAFQTHVGGVETHLTHRLTDKEELKFEGKLEIVEEREEVADFGDWIYIPGRGFYAKIARRSGQFIRPGQTIPREEIPPFLRTHLDELETISGFFAPLSPVLKSGLRLSLNKDEKIVVSPQYEFLPSYANKTVHLFDNFTYVEGEGFSEIPSAHRLPDPFGKESVIDATHEPYFVAFEIDTLMPFITSIDPRLQKPGQLTLRILELSEGAGGWKISLEYESDIGRIEGKDVWQAVCDNHRYLFSKAGLLMLKTPRFNWMKNLPKKKWEGNTVTLSPLEWMRLFALEEIIPPSDFESQKLLEEFTQLRTAKPFDLTGLNSQLRGYQETGLQWLWFLFIHGLSGLLCDEMGLGKTHQAMALLTAVHNMESRSKFLVVCPTSVIYHWQELLRRFFPKLRVLVFYGTQRTLLDFMGKYDLILTSYGTLRSERDAKNPFADLSFDVAIFDEIQIAKNSHSQTHKALKGVNAKTRIGLSGTPIENRLLELKALFDVVLPAYMPTDTVFKELFVNPIEKQNDADKKHLLQRFIQPFILRRKKSEVLLELPAKTEEIAYADLSEEQKKLYHGTYKAHREALLHQLKNPSEPVPYLHIFSLLTKLKQICDHPSLILGDVPQYKQHTSGKWELFVHLLEETRASGQKLVVFSQYLGMLDIIESYLSEHQIGFAAIRGSTRDRKTQIEKFQTDPACEVFVGSLQAAGVGIDLIAASVVIHYDRWWNPAKENQATDRVHRIGQSRGVQVFKMVTKGTIEEHIHRLIEKKLGLMEEVLGYDDQDQIKSLTRDELFQLLSLMEDEFAERK